ncbi:unnamed protein product, partial [Mesorhabditis belari]|uniref:DDHD domain-containing protein n=1 Tax=Mesorhabditis belari TaxID=2138241 RepID=A0AAF3EWI6_9BILA
MATPPSEKEQLPQLSPVPPERSVTPVPPARNRKRKVVPLRCSEVRWFYRKKAADQKWIPLKGTDSLRLELRFRELSGAEVDAQTQSKMIEEGIKETNNAVILDGLYIASEDLTTVSALYWKDDTAELRRGTWFLPDWQPLRPEMADAIEAHHLKCFENQTIPETLSMFSEKEAIKKPQLTELAHDNYEVKWSSVIDIFLYNTNKTSRFLRYISWGKPTSLRRGFDKESEWSDEAPPVSHLVLVVHGIGQKGYENLIAENTAQVRDAVYAQMERYYPDEKSRPMFLPIEWRSMLELDKGVTDTITLPKMSSMREALNSTAMDIMYYQSPLYRKEIIDGVARQMNNVYKLFMDNNPSFSGPISIFAHSLGSVITYDILTAWNPILLYDQYVTEAIDEHMGQAEDESSRKTIQEYLAARKNLYKSIEGGMQTLLVSKNEQLNFKVKNLFAVGSPLAVFLVMRGAEQKTVLPDKNVVGRIYNLFHPYDPVAYRLEPLFAQEYRWIRPVKLFSASDLRGKDPYDDLPMELHKQYIKKLKAGNKAKKGDNKNGDAKSEEIEDEDDSEEDARSACSSPRSLTPPVGGEEEKPAKKGWFWTSNNSTSQGSTKSKASVKEKEKNEVEVAKEAAEMPIEKMTELDKLLEKVGQEMRPPMRIDFNVQPSLTDKGYWSVLKSHFAYWTNTDIALFLVNVLYDSGRVMSAPKDRSSTVFNAANEKDVKVSNAPVSAQI